MSEPGFFGRRVNLTVRLLLALASLMLALGFAAAAAYFRNDGHFSGIPREAAQPPAKAEPVVVSTYDAVIRPLARPIYREGALAVLRGNLAPSGCVIKPSACDPKYLRHTGPALVFDDYPALKAAIDDESLEVTADHVLVLRNAGPQGGPGMPEWGMLPIPKKLLTQGVRDMVRISDARMSGTSYGACILHVAPESFVGGPLALVRTGDLISVDVAERRIHLEVSDEELARRKAGWTAPPRRFERGYGWMFSKHIRQADSGCDFDFLETSFGAPVGEPDIF